MQPSDSQRRLGAEEQPLSPSARLVNHLRLLRGTVLRAWKLDLDVRGNGRVAYTDFTTACRKLGGNWQGKVVWSDLRKDKVASLELHDLAPDEANNLEDFAETLWNTVGFDLAKAWLFLDTNNQNYLTLEEFKNGLHKLGFEGDAKLLFRGLDASGLGRVKRSEFDYIAKVSRTAQKYLGAFPQRAAVPDLITWVQRELGGASEFMSKLGLGVGQREIVVGDLAARLTALGFEGDSLQAAARAARAEGGTHISAECLCTLLSGGRPRVPGLDKRLRKVHSAGGGLSKPINRAEWCNGVDNISELNTHKCKYTRGYFTPLNGLVVPSSPRTNNSPRGGQASPRSLTSATPRVAFPPRNLQNRPEWTDNYDQIQQVANQGVTRHSRHYFSDPLHKPVRDEIRAKIEAKRSPRQGSSPRSRAA